MELEQTEEERIKTLMLRPETLGEITRHLSNGGSLIELCQLWKVPFSEVMTWINSNPSRQQAYNGAMISQMAYHIERVIDELKKIALVDMSEAFDERHRLKPLDQMPEDIRRSISSIDVEEIYEGVGKEREMVGYLKRIKTYDKVKGLELIGKKLQMFVDRTRIEVTQKSLEDLIVESMSDDVIDVTPSNNSAI